MERCTWVHPSEESKLLNNMAQTCFGLPWVVLVVKNPPANAGDIRDSGLIPGSGRSPNEGMAAHSRILAWRRGKDRGAWQAIVHRVAQSWNKLSHSGMLELIRTNLYFQEFSKLVVDSLKPTTSVFISRKLLFSCSVVSDCLQPHGLYPARLLCPWNFPCENTGVGCHFLLQWIFLTQRSSPHLLHFLHWHVDSLPRSHREALKDLWISTCISIYGLEWYTANC